VEGAEVRLCIGGIVGEASRGGLVALGGSVGIRSAQVSPAWCGTRGPAAALPVTAGPAARKPLPPQERQRAEGHGDQDDMLDPSHSPANSNGFPYSPSPYPMAYPLATIVGTQRSACPS